jgi:hypothetical protein
MTKKDPAIPEKKDRREGKKRQGRVLPPMPKREGIPHAKGSTYRGKRHDVPELPACDQNIGGFTEDELVSFIEKLRFSQVPGSVLIILELAPFRRGARRVIHPSVTREIDELDSDNNREAPDTPRRRR